MKGRFSKKETWDRAEKLKRAALRPDLIGLAERPLLITVMALLHTFRGQLPDDRVELYQWTVDLLLRRWKSRVSGKDWKKAGKFVEYVLERAGLLIRHKPHAYTFPHRTFQEFMAACHPVSMKDYPRSAARITREDPHRWRIVFYVKLHISGDCALRALSANSCVT